MGVPYWLESEAEPFVQRRLDGAVEVAVIGGGVTGCSCALTLGSAGRRVRLYEARTIASGASGRNGGFGLRGGATAYDVAREQLGNERARSYWQLTDRYVERLAALAGDAFRRVGSLRVATDEAERAELAAEYHALREDGFEVEWRDRLDGRAGEVFGAALFHPGDGALTPGRWIRRLAALAAEAGAELREHARVEALAELDAEQIVIATDGYTDGLVPELDRAIRPVRNQVIVTEPLAEQRYPLPHYGRYGYDYWQQLPDGRLVVGGRRDADLAGEQTAEEALTPVVQQSLEALVRKLVGELPRITHRWPGIFGVTADRLPLVGPLPGQERVWVAAGYSGHGNVLGLASGDLVARAILGETAPELELFEPARVL
jgi:glycine/D-amino acid oxidase-like deaminating enzyme